MRTIGARLLVAFTLLLSAAAGTASAASMKDVTDAIKRKDEARVEALLRHNPALAHRRTESGITLLMLAAYTEQPALVTLIRRSKQDLDVFEACVVGDLPRLKRLIAIGQDINQRAPDGFTLLGLAIFFRQPDTARWLIDAGADLNAKADNTAQVAPIHAAVARSDLASLQILLLRGADPNATQQRLNRPVHEAAAAGNLPAIAMLAMFGADMTAKNEEGKTVIDFARDGGHGELASRLATLISSRSTTRASS